MSINIRAKGQNGEREIADILNETIYSVMKEMGFPDADCLKALTTVQRNQNQSAVGGNDLTNCMGMSIEVKRQEAIAAGAWWKQCVAAAERNNELPVLLYRQNRKPWHVRTYAWVNLPDGKHIRVVVEFDMPQFKEWFRQWVKAKLLEGEQVRS
jgi:hypothetical protein